MSTVAIGSSYLESWEKNALPTWQRYCERHNLGLIVFDQEMLPYESNVWKKANWQKLLIGHELCNLNLDIANVLYLDTDILISPLAPCVFKHYDDKTICLVSQVHGLPQPLHSTLRRLAFLRNKYWDSKYPLDSALFMTPKQIFEYHNVVPFDNYTCTGFFVFNVANHSSLLKSWFDKYKSGTDSITGGGEEPHLNYELFNWGKLSWLPYEYQALWTYEIAWRYPFLFEEGLHNQQLVRSCIEASLYANHFLHFAGSWHEAQMWKIGGFFSDSKSSESLTSYLNYLEVPVTGSPKGMIKPS